MTMRREARATEGASVEKRWVTRLLASSSLSSTSPSSAAAAALAHGEATLSLEGARGLWAGRAGADDAFRALQNAVATFGDASFSSEGGATVTAEARIQALFDEVRAATTSPGAHIFNFVSLSSSSSLETGAATVLASSGRTAVAALGSGGAESASGGSA